MNLNLFVVLIYTVCIAADSESDKKITPRSEAASWQFTYQVSLQQTYSGHFCSGAVLNKRFILTTADCVFAKSPSTIYAILGHGANEYGHRVDIKNIKKHESFDLYSKKNDIALLNTVEEIEYSYRIDAVTLPPSYWGDKYVELTVSGWDHLKDKKMLQYQPASVEDCKPKNTYEYVSKDVICAGFTKSIDENFKPGQGSLLTDGIGQLVGILSDYHSWLSDKPDVYTRIPSYLTWIKDNSKFETNEFDMGLWIMISIISFAISALIVIVAIVVKYVKSQNKSTHTETSTAAPAPAQASPSELAPPQNPTPMTTVLSYQYPTQMSNLQPVNTGFPQPFIPMAPPSAQYSTIPAQVAPPPTYTSVYPTKSEFDAPPQHQF